MRIGGGARRSSRSPNKRQNTRANICRHVKISGALAFATLEHTPELALEQAERLSVVLSKLCLALGLQPLLEGLDLLRE